MNTYCSIQTTDNRTQDEHQWLKANTSNRSSNDNHNFLVKLKSRASHTKCYVASNRPIHTHPAERLKHFLLDYFTLAFPLHNGNSRREFHSFIRASSKTEKYNKKNYAFAINIIFSKSWRNKTTTISTMPIGAALHQLWKVEVEKEEAKKMETEEDNESEQQSQIIIIIIIVTRAYGCECELEMCETILLLLCACILLHHSIELKLHRFTIRMCVCVCAGCIVTSSPLIFLPPARSAPFPCQLASFHFFPSSNPCAHQAVALLLTLLFGVFFFFLL